MPPASQSENWVFITTSPTHRRPTDVQRSQMRQRVMRDIGYARRTVPRREEGLLQEDAPEASRNRNDKTLLICARYGQVSQPLFAEQLSPSIPTFTTYSSTLKPDAEVAWLLQHMFSNTTSSQFRIYRNRWYPLCVTNSAAFDQMLATYATHIVHDSPDSSLHQFILTSHAKALAGVRGDLNTRATRDKRQLYGTLIAVAALACYSHLQKDQLTWRLHMTAISRLIKESGFSPGELDGVIIKLIQWVESIGCYAFALPPSLDCLEAVDSQHLPAYIEPLPPCLSNVNLSSSLSSAIQALRRINTHLCQRAFALGQSVWRDPVEIDEMIHPLTYQLLSELYDSDPLPISSSVRSAVLLYLAEFRRRSGISPVTTDVHLQRLCGSMDAMGRAVVNPNLTLWLLTVGAVEAKTSLDRQYFYSRLYPAFQAFGITSILLWKQHLQELMWSDYLFDIKLDAIWASCQCRHTQPS